MSFRVVGIGEVLWDLLPAGAQLGGAPANVAYHAHALGATASLVTRVGNDDLGKTIVERFEQIEIADDTIQVDDVAPTGTVTVALSRDGIPRYRIHENVAWDHLAVTTPALTAVRAADAVCFGSLAQRGDISRHAIQRLVAAASATALRVLDINVRQNYFSRDVIERSLRLANVLKLNDDELPILAQLFGLTRFHSAPDRDPHADVQSPTGCSDTRSGGQPAVSGGRMVRLPVGSDHRCGYDWRR